MSLKNIKEMTLEELKAERKPLRQQIKRMGRCGHRTTELQQMKCRNLQLKDEIERRSHVPKPEPSSTKPEIKLVKLLEIGEGTKAGSTPLSPIATVGYEDSFLRMANG